MRRSRRAAKRAAPPSYPNPPIAGGRQMRGNARPLRIRGRSRRPPPIALFRQIRPCWHPGRNRHAPKPACESRGETVHADRPAHRTPERVHAGSRISRIRKARRSTGLRPVAVLRHRFPVALPPARPPGRHGPRRGSHRTRGAGDRRHRPLHPASGGHRGRVRLGRRRHRAEARRFSASAPATRRSTC